MPRFVILLHECPPSYARPTHYDLMLEAGDALRTWALETQPVMGKTIASEALADHRLAYLDFDGLLSADRGSVTPFDRGTFMWVRDTTDLVEVRLAGELLRGMLRLVRDEYEPQQWQVTLTQDPSRSA